MRERVSGPVWLVCASIVIGACYVRFGPLRASTSKCVPVEHLERLETELYAAMDRAATRLRSERDELAAENARLRRALDGGRDTRRMDGASPLGLKPPDVRGAPSDVMLQDRACGSPSGLTARSAVLWQNHHGKLVRRRLSLHGSTLSVCKRSDTPEEQLDLTLASTIISEPLGAAGESEPPLVRLQLRSRVSAAPSPLARARGKPYLDPDLIRARARIQVWRVASVPLLVIGDAQGVGRGTSRLWPRAWRPFAAVIHHGSATSVAASSRAVPSARAHRSTAGAQLAE